MLSFRCFRAPIRISGSSSSVLIRSFVSSPTRFVSSSSSASLSETSSSSVVSSAVPSEETSENLRSIGKQVVARRIREMLRNGSRRRMSALDFELLCTDRGMSREDASRLMEALHTTGDIFVLNSNQDSSLRRIDVKPHLIADEVYRELGIGQEERDREISSLLEKLGILRSEFDSLHATKSLIDTRAIRSANRWLWMGFLGFTAQFGSYAYLTWWEFSWDVMEPITFFVAQSLLILTYSYFAFTKRDYSGEELFAWVYARRKQKEYAKTGFDISRYEDVCTQIAKVEGNLDALRRLPSTKL